MRKIVRAQRQIQEQSFDTRRTFHAALAEEYDGIGQYVLVKLSGAAVGSAYKARIASGDFGTGQTIPAGTPVTVFSYRGHIEILSLGAK
jgi:predicted ATPase